MGRRAFVTTTIACGALTAAAPGAALASTAYGGGARTTNGPKGTTVGLVRTDDGRVDGRVALYLGCKPVPYPNVVVGFRGPVSGDSFVATAQRKLRGGVRLRIDITGAFAGSAAAGKLKITARGGRCPNGTSSFSLRAVAAPTGAPTLPGADAQLFGTSSQGAAGIPLGVQLAVSKTAKTVVGVWHASMRCGPKAVLDLVNFSPGARIAPDGTFSKSETFTIRYSDHSSDTYSVRFGGRFLADGATGTLRARMQTRKKGSRFYPCDSGSVTWSATA